MISQNEWKWFGSPGHLCVGQWCRFHLCTQVGKFLVSTVGEYVHPRNSGGSEATEFEWLKNNWPGEDVGYKRKYETMVMEVNPKVVCARAGCRCGMPQILRYEVKLLGANQRGEASKNHFEMCLWAAKQKT